MNINDRITWRIIYYRMKKKYPYLSDYHLSVITNKMIKKRHERIGNKIDMTGCD